MMLPCAAWQQEKETTSRLHELPVRFHEARLGPLQERCYIFSCSSARSALEACRRQIRTRMMRRASLKALVSCKFELEYCAVQSLSADCSTFHFNLFKQQKLAYRRRKLATARIAQPKRYHSRTLSRLKDEQSSSLNCRFCTSQSPS